MRWCLRALPPAPSTCAPVWRGVCEGGVVLLLWSMPGGVFRQSRP